MATHKERTGKTRVGKFLSGVGKVAPDLLNLVGNVTGVDMLKNIGNAIKNDPELSVEDKATALALLELDKQEMQEISERWSADMVSDSWLSKNVRPMALIALTVFIFIMIISDSKENWTFEVNTAYIELMKTLLVVVYVAYFGSRGVEKYHKIKKQ
jgi:hypothetical protein